MSKKQKANVSFYVNVFSYFKPTHIAETCNDRPHITRTYCYLYRDESAGKIA